MPNPTSKLNLVINGTTTQLDIHDANAVDLTNNQTVAGNKEFTGTTTAHDLVPSATDTYNFGSSTAQWNNAYIKSLTINGVACGDILTHNASEFVDVSSNQTISGLKSFNDVCRYYIDVRTKSSNFLNFKVLNIELDSETNLPTKSYSFSQNITSTNPALYLGNYYSVTPQGRVSTDIRNYKYGSNKDYAGIIIAYTLADDTYISIKCNRFVPYTDNTTVLGSTALKWADVNTNLINGINPGALSLPGASVNVDTTNWVLDGTVNVFTPTSDGWFGIQATDTVYDQMHYVFVGRTDDGNTYYQQNVVSPINALWDGEYHGCVFIPVVKNFNYDIRCICSTIVAAFYPCQGNV